MLRFGGETAVMIFIVGYIGGLMIASALGIRYKSRLWRVVHGLVAGVISVITISAMVKIV